MIKYLLAALLILPVDYNVAANRMKIYEAELQEIVITAKAKIKNTFPRQYMGYILCPGVNSNIHSKLKEVLENYNGPKPLVTSLRRSWNNESKHNHGKAVDFAWSEDMIDYLVSEEGQSFLDKFNLTFYIEDKPGSKRLNKYLNNKLYSKFVFPNPNCTGPHIHIGLND
jgi:hypothetical protein